MAKENAKDKDKKKKIADLLLTIIVGIPILVILKTAEGYVFVNGIPFPLWYVALALGIFGGVLFALMNKAKRWDLARILACILVAFICFWVAGNVLAHLNHMLDSAEVEQYIVRIEEKYSTGGRKHRRYIFEVTVEGETLDITVSGQQYSSVDEGDLYVVEYHKGAFNEPYYIGVGGISD